MNKSQIDFEQLLHAITLAIQYSGVTGQPPTAPIHDMVEAVSRDITTRIIRDIKQIREEIK